jgi:uncharacterized membrane protein
MSAMAILRFVHLLAVVAFLGDIVITAVWKWCADETGEAPVARYAQRQVQRMDKYVLIPSIVLLIATGYLSAYLENLSVWSNPPLAVAQVLFVLSGVVWSKVLRPIQLRQLALVEGLGATAVLPAEYRDLSRRWLKWGLVALALPFGSMFLMVVR